eukprot:3289198-Alexandrium_andersonii.AAC.1
MWSRKPGALFAPRREQDASEDLDLTSERGVRRHWLRDAWREATWRRWRDRSLRQDAGLARATGATWQPGAFKA